METFREGGSSYVQTPTPKTVTGFEDVSPGPLKEREVRFGGPPREHLVNVRGRKNGDPTPTPLTFPSISPLTSTPTLTSPLTPTPTSPLTSSLTSPFTPTPTLHLSPHPHPHLPPLPSASSLTHPVFRDGSRPSDPSRNAEGLLSTSTPTGQ